MVRGSSGLIQTGGEIRGYQEVWKDTVLWEFLKIGFGAFVG